MQDINVVRLVFFFFELPLACILIIFIALLGFNYIVYEIFLLE